METSKKRVRAGPEDPSKEMCDCSSSVLFGKLPYGEVK